MTYDLDAYLNDLLSPDNPTNILEHVLDDDSFREFLEVRVRLFVCPCSIVSSR
jgi:hypothetical protein